MVVILLVAPFTVNGLCASDNSKKNANNPFIKKFKVHSQCYNQSGQTKSKLNQRTNENINNITKNCVRHITRVNISDVYSQIDINDDTEPITKQGELI